MKKQWAVTFVAAAALFGAAAGVRAEDKITIGVSYQNLAFPFVAALQKAAQNACKALDVTCIEADAVNDTNKELSNVESMMSKGISCLAFEAASLEASVASINAANKKGIPVVQFNGKAGGGDYVTFGADRFRCQTRAVPRRPLQEARQGKAPRHLPPRRRRSGYRHRPQ
jgi:ABC-type sugar transport system substrate-binding protein